MSGELQVARRRNKNTITKSMRGTEDVFVLESVAKAKDERRFEGKCYIDQNTFDVLKIDVKPSENPKNVQEMRTEMEFEVLPGGFLP